LNVLFCGNGKAGSWQIRGEQIGRALGATVKADATKDDFRRADVVVCVKRVPEARLRALREARTPWILDMLDMYPQPACSAWFASEAIAWVRARIDYLMPHGIIWPNRQMAVDVGFNGPQAVIYHHHREGIAPNPVRETVQTVAYEGAEVFLSSWRPIIERECAARGWRFVVNPRQLADCDIVLALRGTGYGGYVPYRWKSNVKLANAHGSGTPFIGHPESGYLETQAGAERWATDARELRAAFDGLEAQAVRRFIALRFLEKAYSIDHAANDYRAFLCGARF
jgi:hypothetical protein